MSGDWVAILGNSYGLTNQQTYFYADVPRVIVFRDGRVVWREEDVKESLNPWREGRVEPSRLAEVMALARRNGFFSASFAARIPLRTLPSDMPGDRIALADGAQRRVFETHALAFLGPQPGADGLTRACVEVSSKIDALLPRPGTEYRPNKIRVGRFPSHAHPERAVDWPVTDAPIPPPPKAGLAHGETVYSGAAANAVLRASSRSFTFKAGDEVFNAYWSPAIGLPEPEAQRQNPAPLRSPPVAGPWTFAGHKDAVTSVAWSPSGTLLATSSPAAEDQPRIWNLRTGRLEAKLELMAELVAWQPQGEALAVSKGGACFLFQSPWKEFQDIGGARDWTSRELSWHPDGNRVVTSAGYLAIWDARKRVKVHEIERRWGAGARWHPDGKRLCLAHRDGSLEIYHVPTQRSRMLRSGIGKRRVGIRYPSAWRPDGKWLAAPGVMDGTVRIWETETGRAIHKLEGNGPTANSLAWSPNGRWLAATSGDRILLWAPAHGKQQVLKTRLEVYSVCWSPDGKQLAVGCSDGTARIWPSPVASGLTAEEQRSAEGRKEGKKGKSR